MMSVDPTHGVPRRQAMLGGLATLSLGACADTLDNSPKIIRSPNIQHLTWSLDGRKIAGSDFSQSYVSVWDVATRRKLWHRDLSPHAMALPVAFVHGSKYLATVWKSGVQYDDYKPCLLSADDGSLIESGFNLSCSHSSGLAPSAMVSSADQRVLAIALANDNSIYLTNFDLGNICSSIGPILTYRGDVPHLLTEIALSPEGNLVAVSLYTGEVQVFDTKSGKLICKIRPYASLVVSGMAFANESVLVTSAGHVGALLIGTGGSWHDHLVSPLQPSSRPGAIKLWDVAKGTFLANYDETDISGIEAGSLAACSSFVVSLFGSGFAEKRDLMSGHLLFRVQVRQDYPLLAQGYVAISAGANTAVASSNKITIL